ncbi:PSD1 and planctomycete cytochrome C domain-containing protein [Tautonia marina]|uniref:PSD1 and planctomycete cytochrome C domain-containing protein n=1 Tax=Tautonia marina TaxID=2653855 RepID=UPI001260C447|nr:PSD1 and planctomycete cytochrome C domain-containing protein [Tautonia marina]
MHFRSCIPYVCLVILGCQQAYGVTDDQAANDFFESEIRPLLVEQCLSCHGDEKPKGGLAFTSRQAILEGGHSGPAAEPGQPDASFLIEVVGYDSEPRMPPKGKLSDGEIEALTRWIELGIPWPDDSEPGPSPAESVDSIETAVAAHWAFQPVRSVTPPTIRNPERARTPIDQFILDRLDAEGLALAPEADRRTLIRRLSVHLTGLPPTPAEVDAFVRDDSPDAYDRLVDRLLDSPRFGEHWARKWLDVARYSDTKGYVYAREESSWVHARSYRDWVIRALNEDLPYDRFLLLQVAADQVADDPSDLAAMGFLTLGRRFLGVKHDIIDDRIDVVTRGMLGMTVACARCHDHKYDPIPTADYYGLYGVFRNSAELLVPAFEATERGGASASFEQELQARRAALQERLASERAAAADRVRERLTEYLLAQFSPGKYPDEAFSQILTPNDLIPASVHRWQETLDRAERTGDPIFRAWHEFTRLPETEFSDRAEEISKALAGEWADEVNPLVAIAFQDPPTDREDVAAHYGALFEEVMTAWKEQLAEAEALGSARPEGLEDPNAEAIRRVLFGPDSPCEVPDEALVNIEFFFPTQTTSELWKLQGEVDRWLIQSAEAPPYATILVDREATIEPRVFRRGNSASPGEVVPRRFLQAIAGTDAEPFQDGSGRLELAQAIVDPTNPLTARVAVNRVWMGYFGEGLVRSPGDFGTRAEPPSHPELLDWLASRFMAEGWSVKDLHRQIVRSATYRQSARGPSDPAIVARAEQVDPENRLLWRMPVHRLTFEELRDGLLSVSGSLEERLGGAAEPMFSAPFSTRRTVYGKVDRENLPSILRVFDFANPDLLIPQRSETTVPQQALFFLNHPFLLERARELASRPEVLGVDEGAERVRRLYHRVYQREPTTAQIEASLALVRAAKEEPADRGSQTSRDWQYGYGRLDEDSGRVVDFQPLPFFSGTAWQGGSSWPDGSLGWLQLTAEGGHPGNDRSHAVVRRWVAPKETTIRIQSTLIHEVARGDGIRGFVSASHAGLIAKAEVHDDQAHLNVEALPVKAGDTIDFVVDLRETLNSNQFLWAPVLTDVNSQDALTWDAKVDFSGNGIERLGPWEQLAQVLLMANEFTFVD